MAYAGQTISNPVTGEHINFLKTTADTAGETIIFECRVEPDKARLAPHRHIDQVEQFTLLSGKLGARVGDEIYTLLPGQSLTLPAKVVHQWWNPTHDEVIFRVEVTPAQNLEATLEAICGMANDGKLTKAAMPRNSFNALARSSRAIFSSSSSVPSKSRCLHQFYDRADVIRRQASGSWLRRG